MSLENQTIGFITAVFDGVLRMERQMRIATYKVDLCFPDHHIVVECDEMNHKDRDEKYEATREKCIQEHGYVVIRFNPNEKHFNIAPVLCRINKIIYQVKTDVKCEDTASSSC